MKNNFILFTLLLSVFLKSGLKGQEEHKGAFEGLIVETYYISDANDATDEDGGSLATGSVTYRVYIDLLPGYLLVGVYGSANHPLKIQTTTHFFNNEDRGGKTADQLKSQYLSKNTVALDSWLTVSAASSGHLGVLKSEDATGSIIGGPNNDGGSEEIAGGLLVNNNVDMEPALTASDGLVGSDSVPEITTIGMDSIGVFADENDGPAFSAHNGSWAVLGGTVGPTAENKVLIAQITTDGELSCHLNIALGIPDSIQSRLCSDPFDYKRVCPIDQIRYVHTKDDSEPNPQETYYVFEEKELSFTAAKPSFVVARKGMYSAVKLFPNPAEHIVTLDIIPSVAGEAHYAIYDLQGRKVSGDFLGMISDRIQEEINISGLEPGIYNITISIGMEVYSSRLVKL